MNRKVIDIKTKIVIVSMALIVLSIFSCSREEFNRNIDIPDFNFPKSVVFQENLSAYSIFVGNPSNLTPSDGYHLLELSSILYTDNAYKQRLIKVPEGTKVSKKSNGELDFPDGTIMTKTFYYYNDERDTTLGKRLVETRLEIKENDIWNVATYIWNQNQNEAKLELNGLDTPISWIDEVGISRSTVYHVPTENECMTCHQSNSKMTPLGPTLLNLNTNITINGVILNQITHLQNLGVFDHFSIDEIGKMVNYDDINATLHDRGRAYLAMNCAHCHNPNGWEGATEREFDFRYEIPLGSTGILYEENKIRRALEEEEMPLLGTTFLDEKGVNIIVEFLKSI